MTERWIGIDGWPCEFSEAPLGQALASAIRALDGAERLSEDEIKSKARFLWSMACLAKDEELERNRPATMKGSEDELKTFHGLCRRLTDHITKMRRPAVAALYAEGADLFRIANDLNTLQEQAHLAFGGLDAPEKVSGAKKTAAAEVTEIAASVFANVTGREPTFTTSPRTGERSGPWPDFLGAIFQAVGINASVGAQVRQLSAKTAPKIDE